MKKTIVTFAALFIFLLPLASHSQTNPSDGDMMKKWQEFMTPGPEQKMMESWNGEWAGTTSMWMAPGTDPVKNISTSTNTMLMGGRYQRSVIKGDFGGMPFEGEGTLAFDNQRKIFISTWIDNFGTSIMYMEGTYDKKTQTITFTGTSTEPMSGTIVRVKETFKIIDNNTQMMEMFMPDKDGKEFKTMEMLLKRK